MKTAEFNVLDPLEKIDRSLVIEASAGTGKTFSIQHLFVRNLLRGVKVNEILVVTFTKASTKELKERILEQLRAIKAGSRPPYLEGKALDIAEALREFGSCEIDTIHAFAKRMLSTYAFEANLFVDQLHDESPLDEEKIKALQDFLRTDLDGLSYSLAQKKILLSLDPTAFVVREKSTTPFLSFNELFQHFVQMSVHFPKEGIKDVLLDIKDQFYKKASAQEIEAFGAALEKALQTLSPESFDEFLFCKECVLDHFSERKKKGVDPSWLNAFQEELTPLFRYAISEEILKKRFMLDLEPLIKERTFNSGRFGFDDILLSMKEAVKCPEFVRCVQARYRVVLIDEFQDTDPIQWEIFSTLFSQGWGGVLYLVGDPKQSIYGFRNADIYTYLKACEQVGEKVSLLTNYRSHPDLIAPLNSFFKMEDFIPLPKIKSSLPYHPVSAGRKSASDPIDRIEFFFAESEDQALLDMTAQIQQKEAKGCCVLVRDKNQGKKVSEILQDYKVPHFFLKRQDWEEHPAIFQLKFFLKALQHPEDLHRVKALLATRLCGLQASELITAPYSELIDKLKVCQGIFKEKGLFAAFNAFLQMPFPEKIPLIQGVSELQVTFKLIEMASLKDDIETFLDRLYLGIEKEEGEFNPKELNGEGVAISTMHMSKGLEFDHVFAIGLSAKMKSAEGIESHTEGLSFKDVMKNRSMTLKGQESESEMIRQLYVALTRAKESLYVPVFEKNSVLSLFVGRRFENFESWLQSEPFVKKREIPTKPTLDFLTQRECPVLTKPEAIRYEKKPHFIHSYTSLSTQMEEPLFESGVTLLPRGKDVGILIHSLLEKIPYSTLNSVVEVQAWIQEELRSEYPWIPYLATLIFDLFRFKLPTGFALVDVAQKEMMRELDFLFQTSREFTNDIRELVTGKMDALFKHQGKYYLIDWKSNWLPSYSQESLNQFMHDSSYPLQAKIYKKALALSIQTIENRSFEESFGGCFYIFLRGLEYGEGVVLWK